MSAEYPNMGRATTERARTLWLEHLCPALPGSGLEALVQAARNNDPALVQGDTVYPYCLTGDDPVSPQGACAIGFALWKGGVALTNKDVDDEFNKLIHRVDDHLIKTQPSLNNMLGAYQFYNDWFDDHAREDVLPLLATWTEEYLAGLAAQFADVNVTPTPVTAPVDADLALVS